MYFITGKMADTVTVFSPESQVRKKRVQKGASIPLNSSSVSSLCEFLRSFASTALIACCCSIMQDIIAYVDPHSETISYQLMARQS